MKIVTSPEAKSDLLELKDKIQAEVSEAIENLKDEPLPRNSYVIRLLDGTEVQCLKLQDEDRNSELNHRVTYDIKENNVIRIYGVFRRNPGYEQIKDKTSNRID